KDSYNVFNFSRLNNFFTTVQGLASGPRKSIWLATGEGMVKIQDGLLETQPPLAVYITKVFSHDSVFSIYSNKISLSHLQNQLNFEFTATGYINERQIHYSYRLVGNSNADWSPSSVQHD